MTGNQHEHCQSGTFQSATDDTDSVLRPSKIMVFWVLLLKCLRKEKSHLNFYLQ